MAERDDPQHQARVVIVNNPLGYYAGNRYECDCGATGTTQPSRGMALLEHFDHLDTAGIRPTTVKERTA